MNKVSLLTLGKKLNDGNLYLLSVHDLEPSGIIVHAYDQLNSKEYILPITEFEVRMCLSLQLSVSLSTRHFVDGCSTIFPRQGEFKFPHRNN